MVTPAASAVAESIVRYEVIDYEDEDYDYDSERG